MSDDRFEFRFLGCGSSGGVPRIGNDWGACDPTNPKNRRLRCSALVQRWRNKHAPTSVLIDTGPDLREQLLAAKVGALNGILYTHEHADHTHGIDDLRVLAYRMKSRIQVWADEPTKKSLVERFDYCFETPPGSNYPAILQAHDVVIGEAIQVEGSSGPVRAVPMEQAHGRIASIGYRFGNLAYSNDTAGFTDETVAALQGLDIWIVDALRYIEHPAHFTVKQALSWIERIKPKRAILTHMHVDLDYETLRRELPDHVEPAYDGMVIPFDGGS